MKHRKPFELLLAAKVQHWKHLKGFQELIRLLVTMKSN
jgi:hypothetical protein